MHSAELYAQWNQRLMMARNPIIAAQRPALRIRPTSDPLAAFSRLAKTSPANWDEASTLTGKVLCCSLAGAVPGCFGKVAFCTAVSLRETVAKAQSPLWLTFSANQRRYPPCL